MWTDMWESNEFQWLTAFSFLGIFMFLEWSADRGGGLDRDRTANRRLDTRTTSQKRFNVTASTELKDLMVEKSLKSLETLRVTDEHDRGHIPLPPAG